MTALPNGDLQKDMYMLLPDVRTVPEGYVLKLKKSIYDWKHEVSLSDHITSIINSQLYCLYVKQTHDGLVYLLPSNFLQMSAGSRRNRRLSLAPVLQLS